MMPVHIDDPSYWKNTGSIWDRAGEGNQTCGMARGDFPYAHGEEAMPDRK
jgi:hypothetical protein